MRPHGALVRILLFALLLVAPMFAQQSVAVLPPLADGNVGSLTRNVVRSAFSDYISAPDSGFIAYDRDHTDLLIKEMGEQRSTLYDENSAKSLGKRLGVDFVCISEITKEGDELLVECKLINVETGQARTESRLTRGGNEEVRSASEAVIKKLLGIDKIEAKAKAEAEARERAEAEARARAARERVEAEATKAGAETGVYAVIWDYKNNRWHYWKDGKEVPPFRYDGFSVGTYCQSGGDNYRLASVGDRLAIAKNESLLHYLPTDVKDARTIAVSSNGDVYAGGWEQSRATVWKNGSVLYRLTEGKTYSMVGALFIFGGDVFVSVDEVDSRGMGRDVTTIWKNGSVLYRLTGASRSMDVFSIFVNSDSNVYAGGKDGNVATIWKNGSVLSRLLNPNGKSKSTIVKSIFVEGTDVYAAGYEGKSASGGTATIWKNGEVLYRLNPVGLYDGAQYLVFVR